MVVPVSGSNSNAPQPFSSADLRHCLFSPKNLRPILLNHDFLSLTSLLVGKLLHGKVLLKPGSFNCFLMPEKSKMYLVTSQLDKTFSLPFKV
jgi:hypothetical protein